MSVLAPGLYTLNYDLGFQSFPGRLCKYTHFLSQVASDILPLGSSHCPILSWGCLLADR